MRYISKYLIKIQRINKKETLKPFGNWPKNSDEINQFSETFYVVVRKLDKKKIEKNKST